MAESGRQQRLFDVHDADWVCLLEERKNAAEPLAGRQADYLSQIRRASLLVDPPDCLSVHGVAFEPNFYIPTHYHDVDQFLFVTRGEFRLGSRVLRPGHGAFMPAGNPYNVQVGRAGGSFLEFREVPAYRTAFSSKDAPLVGPGAPVEIPGWAKPESKKSRTTFFDAETCPVSACTGLGPGDHGRAAPGIIAAVLRYQALHSVRGDGYSLISVAVDRALELPPHHQDADKVIFVLAGEMRPRADGSALRPGAGMFVPAWSPLAISTGPAGVKYLEYRKQSGWHTDWLPA